MATISPPKLLDRPEAERLSRPSARGSVHGRELGQFFTPMATAELIAGMLGTGRRTIRLLDPGAGAGALTAACIERLCSAAAPPEKVFLVAFELDPTLIPALQATLAGCKDACERRGIDCEVSLRSEDFIEATVRELTADLFAPARTSEYDVVVMNPPYRKLRSDSRHRQLLSSIGIEVPNLYAAFMALGVRLLASGGQFLAITPRSFCNGTYFRHFRLDTLPRLRLDRVHVFDSRKDAFRDDRVLQENVIVSGYRNSSEGAGVTISSSASPGATDLFHRVASMDELLHEDDPDAVLHLPSTSSQRDIAARARRLPATLTRLGLSVSTGRVVDFRVKPLLRDRAGPGDWPLLYAAHFLDGLTAWPRADLRKPNGICPEAKDMGLLIPNGTYVLVKRFTSKEERRRVVAAVYAPSKGAEREWVGFENHLNYFHEEGRPLDDALARGLAGFLNSSVVDVYFRQFSGHTQVNAGDLRMLRYPERADLVRLGALLGDRVAPSEFLDHTVTRECFEGSK